MTRDEVIKGLECRLDIGGSKFEYCLSCPYWKNVDHCEWACLTDDIMRDALALLKQGPKRGRWIKTPGYVTPGGDPVWRCSECGKGIHIYGIEHGTYGADVSDGQWLACPNCGALMEGEDTECET